MPIRGGRDAAMELLMVGAVLRGHQAAAVRELRQIFFVLFGLLGNQCFVGKLLRFAFGGRTDNRRVSL
jgi:hypothetical protein